MFILTWVIVQVSDNNDFNFYLQPGEVWSEIVDGCNVTHGCSDLRNADSCHMTMMHYNESEKCQDPKDIQCQTDEELVEKPSDDTCCKHYHCGKLPVVKYGFVSYSLNK